MKVPFQTAEKHQQTPLLRIQDLKKNFSIGRSFGRGMSVLKAVKGANFTLEAGKTLAVVGESGCGKSTLARLILGLLTPSHGSMAYNGTVLARNVKSRSQAQRSQIQTVFQDPYSSLNPRWRIGDQISEAMFELGLVDNAAASKKKVCSLLEDVGLTSSDFGRYPHQFSGGQRQRVCIARALASEPKLIVWDEPTSALDVSVQAQVLNLMRRLQRERGLTYIFISHNLGAVYNIADTIAVMYLGDVVETGPAEQVLLDPKHPYTKMLISAVPSVRSSQRNNEHSIFGEVPNPMNPPNGCVFHPRCSIAVESCKQNAPLLRAISRGRSISCDQYQSDDNQRGQDVRAP